MAKIKQIFKVILQIIDSLIVAISPMVILLFIVGLVVILDRGRDYWQTMLEFERSNLTATATLLSLKADGDSVAAQFIDHNGTIRYGTLDLKYLPQKVVAEIEPNQEIQIRYLEHSYDNSIVIDAHLHHVRNYLGPSTDVLWIMGVCWVIIVIHPEFLYLGFVDDFSKVFATREQE